VSDASWPPGQYHAAEVPVRVLVVSWEYPPIVEGGLARAVRKLSEALVAEEDLEVHVLTRGGEHGPLDEVRHGVHVHRVREPHYPSALPEFVRWVGRMNHDLLERGRALAEEHAFDVVHGHDWLVAVAAKRLADRIGCPLVTTVHATEHGRHQGWVHKPPQSDIHRTERWMVRVADQVLVCSHYMRGHVADVFGIDEARVAVTPNGIDPGDLQPVRDLEALRGQFAAPDEKLVLLVGRLVYEKGFQHALEALAGPDGVIARVGAAGCGVRFLVAGSGTHEWELKDQARRLGLTEHGTFMGWIGDDVLHSLYRIADLTVVPSIYEPFGLVALEAMASGCPCIVADTGGLREVVPNQRVGLRFTARDPRSLGRMVERVLTDDALRERLVAEASEHVLRFDWADVARQTHEAYASLRRAAPGVRSAAGAGRPADE
jgi:glycogen(starch) synthase